MIELHSLPDHPLANEIEEHLKELVVAYKRIPLLPEAAPSEPWVRSGQETYTSESQIRKFLDQLAYEVTMNRMVSSDSCFVHPDSESGCPI